MIKDADFKLLNHRAKDYKKYKNGQNLAEGYKPDFVLKNTENEEYIILESEVNSSRKTFVGGMIKAAHFLTGQRKGVLIFVMKESKNTKVDSIAKQIKRYYSWINELTNLKQVFVISSDLYYSQGKLLKLFSPEFYDQSMIIEK